MNEVYWLFVELKGETHVQGLIIIRGKRREHFMKKYEEYKFKIDVFTPDTLPMARCAGIFK
jgi:hypothetical protein